MFKTLLVWMSLLCLVTACDALPSAAPASGGNDGGVIAPAAQVTFQSPDEVMRNFMESWGRQDFQAMYSQVAPRSREIYPYELFQRRYNTLHEEIGFGGVTYTVGDTTLQGTSAAIEYSIVLDSSIFGEITDPNRIMRLVQNEGGWQVAWAPMDILTGMAADVSLTVQSRFPPRASIYDRNGAPLVESAGTVISLSVIQQDMPIVEDCMLILSEYLLRPYPEIVTMFARYNTDTFFQVGEMDAEIYYANRGVIDGACATNDESAGFQKITPYTGRRYYGNGAATHITGYVGGIPADSLVEWQARGYRTGDIVGLAGIENYYTDELSGRPERYLRLVEPGGTVLRELGGTTGADPVPVVLTIDRELQWVVSKAMNDAYNYALNNWAGVATGSSAVVMDVKTGEILALASYPTFDPNVFNPESFYSDPQTYITSIVNNVRSPLSNKAVQEQYTPGSVYKIITTLATASEDIFPADELFPCDLTWNGEAKFGDQAGTRSDWRVIDEMPAAGPITMSQALTASCNPFFWEMGGTMFQQDRDMLATYSEMLGLGQRTGLNVLGVEAPGNVAHPTIATDAINNAIGQGNVQVTTLQMARVVAAIASRGKVYQPWIVKQIGGVDGTELQAEGQARVIRELDVPDSAFDVVWEGMCQVPINEDLGTAWWVFANVQPLPYTSCGKTGTAEAGAQNSGIPPHAWYASFAPADDPEIAIVVLTTNSREGSEVSAPMVRRILDYYFDAPQAPFPEWWEGEYVPMRIPEGWTG